jgi:hypothetical protein
MIECLNACVHLCTYLLNKNFAVQHKLQLIVSQLKHTSMQSVTLLPTFFPWYPVFVADNLGSSFACLLRQYHSYDAIIRNSSKRPVEICWTDKSLGFLQCMSIGQQPICSCLGKICGIVLYIVCFNLLHIYKLVQLESWIGHKFTITLPCSMSYQTSC